MFQADGTSLDQLSARLSCTDPTVTNAPDRMEEPVQAESAYPPQPAPLAAQEEHRAPAGDPPAALSQEAPVPPSMRLSPAPSHTAPPPQPYHGQFSVQPVQHAPQPLPAPDFSHPAPAPAQYPPVNPNGAPQQNSFPPQRNSYPLQQKAYPPQQDGYPPQQHSYQSHAWMHNPHEAPAALDAGSISQFDGLPPRTMNGDSYSPAPVHPGYPVPGYRSAGYPPHPGAAPQDQQRHHDPLPQRRGTFPNQVPMPVGPGPPSFGAPPRVKQEFPNPPVRQGSGGAAIYGAGRQGPTEFVDLTFSDDGWMQGWGFAHEEFGGTRGKGQDLGAALGGLLHYAWRSGTSLRILVGVGGQASKRSGWEIWTWESKGASCLEMSGLCSVREWWRCGRANGPRGSNPDMRHSKKPFARSSHQKLIRSSAAKWTYEVPISPCLK